MLFVHSVYVGLTLDHKLQTDYKRKVVTFLPAVTYTIHMVITTLFIYSAYN